MRYYPIYLDVQGCVCLIVGGGAVGTRKAEALLKAGAQVAVVSPEVTPRLAALAKADQIRLHRRPYTRRDMEGAFLVFGTTDDRDLNRRVSEDANRLKVLCNMADQPDRGQFILPALVQRGDLLISVSTSGKSPALARRIRRQIENTYDTEYARMLDLLGALRRRLLDQGSDPRGHKKLFEVLLDSDLLEWIKAGDTVRIDQFLHQHFGETFDWKDLMAPTQ